MAVTFLGSCASTSLMPIGAVRLADHDDADEQAEVGDAGHQERLGGTGARLRRLPLVPDQQVRAQTHDLPADQQDEEVVGHDDGDHAEQEQDDDQRVRAVARVVLQVGRRVDLHQQADADGEQQHLSGERVEVHRQRDAEQRVALDPDVGAA